MTSKLLIPSILSIALLQACGGGGGGDGGSGGAAPAASTRGPATTTAPADTPTGASDAGKSSTAFVAGTKPRYHMQSASFENFGYMSDIVQAPSGAVTTLSGNVLSDDGVVIEVSGDPTYAMGRWVAGTVTHDGGVEKLSGADNRAYHYIAVNAPAQFPKTGALNCDAGMFTTPTYQDIGGSGTHANSGTATGSATLSFGASGAVIAGVVKVSVSGSTGATSLASTTETVAEPAFTSNYFVGGDSKAVVQIGDAGGGAFHLAVGYRTKLTNGAEYLGVAKFRCAA